MKKNIDIPEGTNLNDMIAAFNNSNEPIKLDEKTLMFDSIIYDNLPSPLNGIKDLIKKPAQRDMVLMAILTILSGILKNYKVVYRRKKEGCQLYTYILANPGQGKGMASTIKNLGTLYHESFKNKYKEELKDYKRKMAEHKNNPEDNEEPQKPSRRFLFCPGNNTKAALSTSLFENGGYGLIYETEADTLFSANAGEFGGFGDVLRMGFHGEAFSTDRKYLDDGPLEIDSLFISIFLTSTLNQCFKLIPTSEDGLFSRFLYYFLPTTNEFENAFEDEGVNELNVVLENMEKLFYEMGDTNNRKENIIFKFTEQQANEHTQIFKRLNKDINIEDLSGSKMRFGLIFTRICMLLSFLREWNQTDGNILNTIQCNETDFYTTCLVVEKLFYHTVILDNFYETKNVRQKNLVYISKTIGDDVNSNKYSAEVKEEAIKYLKKGLSYSVVAEKLLGNAKLKPTIFKWDRKYKEGSLPVSQKGNTIRKCVNVKEMLSNTKVSFFENVCSSVCDEGGLNLNCFITGEEFKFDIEKVRRVSNPERRKQLKNRLCAYTPSGLFAGSRSKEKLIKHSGFICIDIDEKGNEGILNFGTLKKEFAKITNVAFCGHSVSGKGYYLLIPIDTDNDHELYFAGLTKAFKVLGVQIDESCKDVSRLRIISYDDACYLADTAEVLTTILNPHNTVPVVIKFDRKQKGASLRQILDIIEKDEVDITGKQEDWVAIGYALVNEFGESGEEKFHSISKHYPKYTFQECSDQYKECLKSVDKPGNKCKLATIVRIAREHDLI